MVQVLPAVETFGQQFAKSVGRGISKGISEHQSEKELMKENEAIYNETGIAIPKGLRDPEQRKIYFKEQLKKKREEELQNKKEDFYNQLTGRGRSSTPGQKFDQEILKTQLPHALPGEPADQMTDQEPSEGGFDPTGISDESIIGLGLMDPQAARILQGTKDVKLRERREEKSLKQRLFQDERSFHTGYSKEAEKEASQLRSSIPKKEMALDFARNAVESGDVSFFSKDKLADATGLDLFRTSKGAQLVTAGKENLLSNMSRVTAKAQNIWFEQRLNSMFPKIGQSKEANLTVQEMLEGEASLDHAYLNAFDELSAEDEKKYGYVRKDIQKRASQEIKPLEKEIVNRTSYRMREVEEQEKGLKEMKRQVGKNVSKGTPLTLAMAKLYKDEFGENALKVAQKNGYTIPTAEQFQRYRASPQEFREEL